MPPSITGSRPSGFNRTPRTCNSRWQRRHIKSAKAREANGLPALDGAGVADAIRLLTDLLKNHPDMTAAYFALGNIYANERRDREAADEYQEVTRRNPTDTVALGAQVKALIDASAFTEALAPARDYVRRKPNDPSGHVMLGTVYQQTRRLRQGRAGT